MTTLVRFDERPNARWEREGANPHVVDRVSIASEPIDPLEHRRVTTAQRDDADIGYTAALTLHMKLGCRHCMRRRDELLRQSIDDFLIRVGIFGVRGVFVMPRAAREIAAERGDARQGTRGDPVAVDI